MNLKETSKSNEEQKYEKELKNFLFGIAERIESVEKEKQKDVIKKLREEYNCFCDKLRRMTKQNNGKRYSELVRSYAPVLYSCTVILRFYEKGYDSWNHERGQAGNQTVLGR